MIFRDGSVQFTSLIKMINKSANAQVRFFTGRDHRHRSPTCRFFPSRRAKTETVSVFARNGSQLSSSSCRWIHVDDATSR